MGWGVQTPKKPSLGGGGGGYGYFQEPCHTFQVLSFLLGKVIFFNMLYIQPAFV